MGMRVGRYRKEVREGQAELERSRAAAGALHEQVLRSGRNLPYPLHQSMFLK